METAQPAHKKNNSLTGNGFQTAYREALEHARDTLRAQDIAACCVGGGATCTRSSGNDAVIDLNVLNKSVRITWPELSFSAESGAGTVAVWQQILTLHYLSSSEHASLAGNLINYRRLRDGALYAEAFEKRCIQPLLTAFGSSPDSLIEAAAGLGGQRAAYGDNAVRIPVFPQIDIICCLWAGDAEFAPEAAILFDEGVGLFLCAEDIAVMCQQIVLRLIQHRSI